MSSRLIPIGAKSAAEARKTIMHARFAYSHPSYLLALNEEIHEALLLTKDTHESEKHVLSTSAREDVQVLEATVHQMCRAIIIRDS